MTTVYTERELERALERRENKIVFEGPQAATIVSKLEAADAKKRGFCKVGLLMSLALVAAAPFTGGTSLLGLGAAGVLAISDSVIIAIITAVVTLSVEAMRAIKEYKINKLAYNKVEFTKK